jgi:uncharacterized membrane protein
MTKETIMGIIVIFGIFNSLAQLIPLLVLSIGFVVLVIKYKPFKDSTTTKTLLVEEIALIIIFGLLVSLTFLDSGKESGMSTAYNVHGWIIIVILLGLILFFVVIALAGAISSLKKQKNEKKKNNELENKYGKLDLKKEGSNDTRPEKTHAKRLQLMESGNEAAETPNMTAKKRIAV